MSDLTIGKVTFGNDWNSKRREAMQKEITRLEAELEKAHTDLKLMGKDADRGWKQVERLRGALVKIAWMQEDDPATLKDARKIAAEALQEQ